MTSGSNRNNMSIQDEFTRSAGTPGGAHRGRKSLAVRLRPYLLVVLVAVCCALLLWAWMTGKIGGHQMNSYNQAGISTSASQTKSSAKTNTQASSKKSESSSSASSSASSSPSQSSSSSSSSPTVDKTIQVIVYNGGYTAGLAASNQSKLTQAGYSNVSAQNPANRSTLPSVATVWYKGPENKATAEDIARTLGISNVVEVSSISSPIAVIVR